MMIAELIDQDDYYDFLTTLGVSLEKEWTPEQCSQAALAWLVDQDDVVRTQFAVAITEFQEKAPVMLPEVQDAVAILTENNP